MWRSLAKPALALLAGAAVMVTTAAPALGSFIRMASATQAVSAGTLAPPTGVAAAVASCQNNKFVSVQVTWTPSTSSFATGYEVLRDGAVIGTAAGGTAASFTDTTVTWSTSYSYSVRAVRNYWRSSTTAPVAFTTPAKNCK